MTKSLSSWQRLRQKKQAKASDFLETTKDDYVSQPEVNQCSVILHRSCEEVSVKIFKQCFYRGNYSGLGNGTPEQIAEAWEAIVSEWSGLMKNDDSEYKLSMANNILELQKHVFFVESAIAVLQKYYDKEIIDRLINECGYNGNYPDDDKEALLKQLYRVNSMCKSKVYELWELTDEYDRLNKASLGEKDSEGDFDRGVHRLGKYQGYPIDQDKTSIYDLTQIHNNYIADMTSSSRPPES